MLRVDGNDPGPLARSGASIALGIFDGVHLGHQATLARASAHARDLGGPAAVVTFAPHPLAVLAGGAPPEIASLEQRLELFASLGVDAVWTLPFTPALAAESAESFARRVFRDALSARAVTCGFSARFGRDRQGDGARLAEWGRDWGGWRAETVAPAAPAGLGAASSSAVRRAVAGGDLEMARSLLGRRFSLRGRIEPGRRLARTLGCPTANLDARARVKPPAGVYAAWLRVWDPVRPELLLSEGGAVANIGPYRGDPSAPPSEWLVEAHAFDAETHGRDVDWYGFTAELWPMKFLRGPMKFVNENDARSWIAADMAAALNWWAKHPAAYSRGLPEENIIRIPPGHEVGAHLPFRIGDTDIVAQLES